MGTVEESFSLPTRYDEMQGYIDQVLEERGWPCNPKAAARAGWEACARFTEAYASRSNEETASTSAVELNQAQAG